MAIDISTYFSAQYLWTAIKYIIIVFVTYIFAAIIKYVLDNKVTKFRIDNYLLYLLLAKTPLMSTKIIFKTDKRPDLSKVKKVISENFDLDQNEPVRNNSYLFKIKKHPTPFKIIVIEPDSDEGDSFTIVMETFGDEKIPKLLRGSNSRTIAYFEEISKKMKDFDLKSINVTVKISSYLDNGESMIYNYKQNATLSCNSITASSDKFTQIEPLVKECLKKWRNKFL